MTTPKKNKSARTREPPAFVTPMAAQIVTTLLHLDGVDLTEQPLSKRRARLARVLARSGMLLSQELPGTAAAINRWCRENWDKCPAASQPRRTLSEIRNA